MTNANPILVSIFHERDLYEFRLRNTTILSITHYAADSNIVDTPGWNDLSEEVQDKCIKEVRRILNYDP